MNLWRWADRVLLETAVPPVLEKESLLTGTYVAISEHLLSEVLFLYLNTQPVSKEVIFEQEMVYH